MSFVKKGAAKPAELGTRPGLSGQALVSTGLADFDKLIGGGIPLGTVTLLLEDTYTQHHVTLLKYFLAEGAANNQAVHWSAGHLRHASAVRALPQQVQHTLKDDKDSIQETEEVQLRIAWQYRRYIKSKQKAAASSSSSSRSAAGSQSSRKTKSGSSALGGGREWCHSFDLTKPIPVQYIVTSRMDCPEFFGPTALQSLTGSISSFLDALTQPPDDSSASPAQRTHSSLTNTLAQQGNTAKPTAKLSVSDSVPQTDGSGMVQASKHTASHHVGQATRTAGDQDRLKPPDAAPSTQHSMSPPATAASGPTAAQKLAAVKPVPLQPSVPALDRPQGVGRVVVESLGGLQWQLEGSARDVERRLYTAVFQLKAAIRDSRCAAMMSFPAGLYTPSLTMRLAHLCDTVVGLEAVRDDSDIVRLIPEPASCCGLLHLQKLPSLNALGPPIPDVTLFIIRHKRRRLAIQAVQIDPDAGAGETDTKSAAAALCGGPPKAETPFDF
ncbi:TPA: hypothetical protein ACH3X1_002526 [Trebouxia sp. C0004]